ncbi:MAG TPA: alpha-amylase family glycosyl hydrolase [Myxococcaceae bacterium]|nr:alpha-amylase family glycosyl hydrolase [Myxococcaceae bacterium]
MTLSLERVRALLQEIYPQPEAKAVLQRLAALVESFCHQHPELQARSEGRYGETDVVLITYGDQVSEPGRVPLRSLDELLRERAGDFLTGVHLLPFYPYTSDDGFSVVDYFRVDPALGTWDDVARMGEHFKLMFDAVVNHVSAASEWFQGYLRSDPKYAHFFIAVDPSVDLSQVTRPRALPLLTKVETAGGTRHVWTTFSTDQVDLNFAHSEVLLEVTRALLLYVARGARLIRMDAIAYLWKEIGTSCIHLPRTHRVVQLWRAVLDAVAPDTLIITETNVPHAENVSYFGDGTNEAQLVYQFPLAPLTLHAFHTGNSEPLQRWAMGLEPPSSEVTFFNFLASHDGIGVRPAEGILTRDQIGELEALALAHGGHVSYKSNPDGSQSPYELNVTYFDALNDPSAGEPVELQVDRFIAAQAILLALAGVPGIYVHSLFGSRNWNAGVARTGRYRTINRRKFVRAELEAELDDPQSLAHRVFHRFRALIRARTAEKAFHPGAPQKILAADPGVFGLVRASADGQSRVLCLQSVSREPRTFSADLAPGGFDEGGTLMDLLTGERSAVGSRVTLSLPPYAVRWLRQS